MADQKKHQMNRSELINYSTRRLFNAIRDGEKVFTIQALLQESIDFSAGDSKGYTPLLLACLYHQKRIVDCLIKSGTNVDGKCKRNEYTVLHHASQRGWTRIVRSLMKKVSDLNARDVRGDTAMHHASRSGHFKIVKYLVEEGADKNLENALDFTPLLCAVKYSSEDVADLLLNFGASVTGYEERLLYYAARNGWIWLVRLIMKKKVPDLTITLDRFGDTALHVATSCNHLEIMKYLVEEGIDVNVKNESRATALHNASCKENLEIVKWLVEKGTDINTRDEIGRTALHRATKNERLEVVRYLVERGADLNLKDDNGETPLLCAASSSFKNIVDLLMHSGANVYCSNKIKLTLLHFASQNGWLEIVDFLVKRKCDLDARDKYGVTALGDALMYENYVIAKYLLQSGAGWDITDEEGYSPLNYVTREDEPTFELIELLIESGAYLKHFDYDAIVKKSLNVLQDANLCCQIILNKYNNHDLPKLYNLIALGSLPHIEKVKIAIGSKVAQVIEQTVGIEIQTKGYCNIFEVRPMVLSVQFVLIYYEKKKFESENHVKWSVVSDIITANVQIKQ